MIFDPSEHPHRRRNSLTGRHVLVSPHRARRPWQGAAEAGECDARPSHDPGCYLCAGNLRASGERNPDYRGDRLVAIADKVLAGNGGVRMTGGGFGGCIVALAPLETVTALSVAIRAEFRTSDGHEPDIFVCRAAAGAEVTWLDASA